jgi:hypothetical protein
MFGLGGRGTELADIWVGLLEWVCEKQEELVAALTRVSS